MNIFDLMKPRASLKAVKTRKGTIKVTLTGKKTADEMMQLVYITLGYLAKSYGVDIRHYLNALLKVDAMHKKELKLQADPRKYKHK